MVKKNQTRHTGNTKPEGIPGKKKFLPRIKVLVEKFPLRFKGKTGPLFFKNEFLIKKGPL